MNYLLALLVLCGSIGTFSIDKNHEETAPCCDNHTYEVEEEKSDIIPSKRNYDMKRQQQVQLLSNMNHTLQTRQSNKILNLIQTRLPDKTIMQIRSIYDANMEIKYYAVELDEGYLLYDCYMNDYIEYTEEGNSPYSNLSNTDKGIYVGPFSYYSINSNNIITEIKTGQTVNSLSTLKQMDTALKDKKDAELLTLSQQPMALTEEPLTMVKIPHSYYIENAEYFNTGGGGCVYRAFSILLGYYDATLNDNFIPEKYDNPVYCLSDIPIEEYTMSPSTNNSTSGMFNELMEDLNLEMGLTINETELMMDYYFENIATHPSVSASFQKVNVFSFLVESNIVPYMLLIRGYDGGRYIYHAVVTYGTDNQNGIWTNAWETDTRYNIQGYTIDHFVKLNITNNTHIHSNNYVWEQVVDSHFTYKCPCGYKSYKHGPFTYNVYSLEKHKVTCTYCNDVTYEDHSYGMVNRVMRCLRCLTPKTNIQPYSENNITIY